MAQVTIRLNGYSYTVNCRDGEEAHLQAMAVEVERRIERVRAIGMQGGESRTLAVVALLMADEIYDFARGKLPGATAASVVQAERVLLEKDRWQHRLNLLAERAEAIADELEAP